MKAVFLGLILLFLLTLGLIPAGMYFSHDVGILKSDYPHILKKKDSEPDFEIRSGIPKNWVKLGQISKYGKWAIVISEDWGFYQHEGVDLNQVKIALTEMWEENKFRGASTITQQMVKNIFLSLDRTLWRKLHEVILTKKAEAELSKDRILEIYLNCIEFGPGIYGIKEASYHYFQKHPAQITAKEGAFLAMLLPSPKRYYISFKKKELTPFARERINTILMKLRMAKILTMEELESEKELPLSWEIR